MLKILWIIENFCWKFRFSKKPIPPKADVEDLLLNTLIHCQIAFENIDKLRGYQDLFNQAERNRLKQTAINVQEKLDIVYKNMAEENSTKYKRLLSEKLKLYGLVDGIDTESQIQLIFEIYKTNGR